MCTKHSGSHGSLLQSCQCVACLGASGMKNEQCEWNSTQNLYDERESPFLQSLRVKNKHEVFPLWEVVARITLSFFFLPTFHAGDGYFRSWDGWFTRKSFQLCGNIIASPLFWHCLCFFSCDNIVKLKQTCSGADVGEKNTRKSQYASALTCPDKSPAQS